MKSERQVGVYSGTFDPIHIGHITFAKQAMRECGLGKVIFLPEPKPRGKQSVTRLAHRLTLISLAIEGEPHFSVLKLSAPRFTVRGTLPKLWQEFGNARLTFLMGSDVAKSLGHWNNVKTLLCGASLAIGVRGNDDPTEITAVMERLNEEQGVPVEYTLISAENANISSSKIRNGESDPSLLPAPVLSYIRRYGLYSEAAEPGPASHNN